MAIAVSAKRRRSSQMFKPSSEENTAKLSSNNDVKVPDPRLSDGMPLPKYLREKFPRHLLGMPIIEIDKFYHHQKTFVIVSSNWVIHRFSSLESLWVLSPFNRLRWILVRTITHSVFQFFMLVVVLSLAVVIPVSQLFKDKKPFFMPYHWIFTIEILMKALAQGVFLKSFSYLRNPWNWMDLILTCVGWYTEFFSQDATLYAVQSLRVLRIINIFTNTRLLFARMFDSLCFMKDLIVYAGFVFCFSIMFALVQYQGIFGQNCVPENRTADILDPKCVFSDVRSGTCRNISTRPHCPVGMICLQDYVRKPRYCLSNFDNVVSAALAIFRVMGRNYWDHLFAEITATSTVWNFMFFVIVLVFGSFLLANFIVGYMAVSLHQFMDILAGKLPKNESPPLVTNIQEFGNAPDSSATNTEQVVTTKVQRNSVCRFRNEVIFMNNLNLEGDETVNDDGNDQDEYYSDNESYVCSIESEESRSIHLSTLLLSWVDKFCIWQCCACWTRLQKRMSDLILSRYFVGFICLCITTNIVILTLDHHEMPAHYTVISYYLARIFTLIYLVEAALKILALSPKYYFTVSWNVLEFLIAICCLLELTMEITGISGLTIIRSFRMFRILRFARWWPGFGSLMKIVTTNSVVFFVVVLLFSTLGVFLFGNNYEAKALNADGQYPRWHTIDFMHSLLLVVRILCGEWKETLTTCTLYNGWPCIPFFMVVVVIGNLVLFHLFITMLMAAIQSNNLCETQLDPQQNLFSIIKDSLHLMCAERCSLWKSSVAKEINKNDLDAPPVVEITSSCEDNTSSFVSRVKTDSNVTSVVERHYCWNFCVKCTSCQRSALRDTKQLENTRTHKCDAFWKQFLPVVTGRYCNVGMITFVILSTLPLCVQKNSFISDSITTRITSITNVAVLVVFSLEFILSILSRGFKNYFKDNWMCFDFVITLVHVVSLVTCMIGFYKIPFIALRPLKLIPRVENLRVVVAALTYRVSLLMDSILACGVFWLAFSLTGMQLFAGRFNRCIDAEFRSLLTSNGLLKNDCVAMNFTWVNANVNFDNIQNSFIALLHVASLKGWIPILYSAVDAVEAPFRPLRNVTIHYGWFFVLFLIFGVFCCFALILSAFMKRTNDHREKIGGYAELLMTTSQRKLYAAKSKTFFCTPKMCVPCFQARKVPCLIRCLTSRVFTLVSVATILANAATTVALYCPNESDFESLFGSLDLGFFLIFVLEVVLKLTVFGRQFFSDRWNIYDMVLIGISTLCYVFLVFGLALFRTGLLSVLRVTRLIRWLKPVQRIASQIWALTPAIFNVGALLVLIMTTYAIIGMTWFSDAHFLPGHETYHNFKTFFPSMIILCEMSLGSGWDFIYAGMVEVDQKSAAVFVSSYLFLCYFIVIGFGVVLFLENYSFMEKKVQLDVTGEDLDNYATTWQAFDPHATGFVKFELLSHFLDALNPRFQIPHPNLEKINAMNIPIMKDNFVSFEDVFEALLKER